MCYASTQAAQSQYGDSMASYWNARPLYTSAGSPGQGAIQAWHQSHPIDQGRAAQIHDAMASGEQRLGGANYGKDLYNAGRAVVIGARTDAGNAYRDSRAAFFGNPGTGPRGPRVGGADPGGPPVRTGGKG